MAEPFIVGIIFGLGALLATGKKGPKAAQLPDPDPKEMKALTEWKPTPQGQARYFRREFIPSIAIQLGTLGVEKVVDTVYKKSRIVVYRLFPAAGGAPSPSALDIAKLGYGYNAAVLVTANVWLHSGGEFYMAVIPYEQRAEWSNAGRQWAIEFDNQAGNEPVTPGRKTPGGTTGPILFDSNMTPEESETMAGMLASSDVSPEWLEGQAIQAETPGHGGTSHGVHPKAAKALRARAKELRDNLIHVKEPPKGKEPEAKKPPKDWGTPDVTDVHVDEDTPPPGVIDDGPPPPPAPFMHTIRTGDIPSLMAAYYTGDQGRYKDLAAIKANGLGLGGPYGMTGWNVGKTIQIPPSWNPYDKPVPGVAQAAPPTYVNPEQPGGTTVTPVPSTDDDDGGLFGDWGI